MNSKPTGVRWTIFALLGAASWLLYLHRYAWGVIKPDFKKDHPQLSDVDMGFLDSAFMVTYAIGQVPWGLVGDIFGLRSILAIMILGWSVCVPAIAWVSGAWAIALVRGIGGWFQAGCYPVIGKATKSWFPVRYRTVVQGTVTAMGRIGGACAPLLVATVLLGLLHLTWQQAMLAIAVPGLVLGVLFYWIFRDSPAEHPAVNAEERALITGESSTTAVSATAIDWSWGNLFNFSALLFYAFLSTFADMLYVFWIPQFLREARNMTNTEMGLFAPLPLIGGAVGGIVGGILNDWLIRKLDNRRWGRSLVALTGKTIAAILIVLSVSFPSGAAAMLLLLACKMFGDWSLPTQWGTITDIGGRSAGTAFGIVNTLGSIGGFVASPIMGSVKQTYGWEGLFYFVGMLYLLAALSWLFIDCTRPLARERAT